MSADITITVPGAPVPKGRPRFGRGRVYTPPETEAYETHVRLVANVVMAGRPPLTGPLAATIHAGIPIPESWSAGKKQLAGCGLILPTTKPDGDNFLKIIDSLNKCVWIDDAQVVDARVIKRYAVAPSLVIEVSRVVVGV